MQREGADELPVQTSDDNIALYALGNSSCLFQHIADFTGMMGLVGRGIGFRFKGYDGGESVGITNAADFDFLIFSLMAGGRAGGLRGVGG